jgi:hypothetical protein
LHVHRDGAPRGQVVGGAGQEFLDGPQAAGEQAVQVRVLRHALAVRGAGRQRVPVDERDGLDVLDQRPRGQQPGDARAEHDRVPGPVGGSHRGSSLH